ncbi:hypothetical protein AGMMS49982_11940 [Bacteroidia bacterium]|nr:hypothetical protein AGMMS49982_11940 [Bacteroidia bacterium]
MKKKFLLVGVVAMLGFGAFVVTSCDDDEETCTCQGESATLAEINKGQTEDGEPTFSSCAEAVEAMCND